jgi:glucan phosphoethanolaminetransferase (alkaline phosphatase superfamily)
MVPSRAYIYLLGTYLLTSLCFIIGFRAQFEYSPVLIPLHLAVVIVLVSGMTLLMGVGLSIPPFRKWRYSKYVLIAIPFLYSTALVTVYLLDIISNRMWGFNVTAQIIAVFSLRLPRFLKNVDVDFTLIYAVAAAMLLAWASLGYAHFKLADRVFRNLEALFVGRKEETRGRRNWLYGLTAGTFAIAYFGALLPFAYHPRVLNSDPVISLFFYQSDFSDKEMDGLAVTVSEHKYRSDYPKAQSFDRKSVFVIFSDSLRADHLSVYGYTRPTSPFLQGLLETGRLKKVEFSASTCSESVYGILSTLSSKYFQNLSRKNFKLHELLKDQGYRVYFLVSGDHSWYGLKQEYGNSIDRYVEGEDKDDDRLDDDATLIRNMAQIPDYEGTPAFFYFFLMSTHSSGVKHDKYQRWPNEPTNSAQAGINTYDNRILQADDVIRQIMEALKHKGYLDKSVGVILADHGDSFWEHESRGHCNTLYQEEIRIPILFYDAPEAKYEGLRMGTQVDVAPTLLDRLGLPIPSSWDGVSLLHPQGEKYRFHQTRRQNTCMAVLSDDSHGIYKYIRQGDREELYDLQSDPRERQNIMFSVDPSLVRKLREEMDGHFGGEVNYYSLKKLPPND